MQLWLKADTGVIKDASNLVSEWDDQSGNNFNVIQATGSKQPLFADNTLNGKPSVKFDGIDDYLQTPGQVNLLNGGDISLFVVVKPGAMQNTYADIIDYTHATNVNMVMQQDYTWTNQFYFQGNNRQQLDPNNFMIFSSVFKNGVSAFSYLNGSNQKGGALSAATTYIEPNYVTIGNKSNQAFPRQFNGDIVEIIVYNTALSDSDRSAVESYLISKYAIDTTVPAIASTTPANSASNFSVSSPASATFSEAMDPSTISASTFTIDGGVTGTVNYSGLTAVFTPSNNLSYNTTYTATITTGAKDLAGNALSADYTWSFTTAPAVSSGSIYVLSSGNSANDEAVLNALTARGHIPVLGVQPYEWDGTQADLSNFDAVVFLNNYNWSSSGSMPANGQTAIINFVSAGGGLVTGEWTVWNIYSGAKHSNLEPLMPAVEATFNYTLSTTYTQFTADPVINNGLPSAFNFTLNNIGGTESFLAAKEGAIVFYDSSNTGYSGLIGWDYSAGRIISFSTLISDTEMADSNYSRLFVNAVEWAGNPAPPL